MEDAAKLNELKQKVQAWTDYFQENIQRFHVNKKFIFVSSVEGDKYNLNAIEKPSFDVNVLEAYMSRLRGEFGIQNPGVNVESLVGDKIGFLTTELVTNICRSIFYDSSMFNLDDVVFKDTMGGGFSVLSVGTKYRHDNTFDQKIMINYPYDVTRCGFDPMARECHKGDGGYCYELTPMYESEFRREYPNVEPDFSNIYGGRQQILPWAMQLPKGEKILMVCDFYEKKFKMETMVLTDQNQTFTMDEYNDYVKMIQLQQVLTEDNLSIIPKIKKKDRRQVFDKIVRYRFIGSEILEKEDTEFPNLPLIFFDGDSVIINNKQFIRPYFHNAKDAQRAKNIVFNMFLDNIQRIRATTVIAPRAAIPEEREYANAYTDTQKQYGSLIYNHVDDKGNPIPAPSPMPHVPMPPEILAGFQMIDPLIQAELGSYDASLGINGNKLSGEAILAGAGNSNSASKPRIMNFLASMNHLAKVIVAMIPKYYTTPSTIPVIDKMGRRAYRKINDANDPTSIKLQYSPNDLNVYVEEGVSFQAQKQQSLNTMVQLANALPGMNQLLSTTGLPILLDNLDIKGGDQLKELAINQLEQAKAAQAAQQSQPPTPNPAQLQMMKLQQEGQYKQQKLSLEERDLDIKEKELELKAIQSNRQAVVDLEKTRTEDERTHANLLMANAERATELYKFHKNHHHEIVRDVMADLRKQRHAGDVINEKETSRV